MGKSDSRISARISNIARAKLDKKAKDDKKTVSLIVKEILYNSLKLDKDGK